ncbi:MAG: DsbA family protein [Marinibacterium sp.]|nr:DsbA family protein [Marinibacterium sp.]
MTRFAALICAALALAGTFGLAQAPLVSQATAQEAAIQEMSLGNPDAPVKITEYASFTCPHCATFHADQFKKLKKDYIDTGKVYFTFREVYFDRYGLWASMIARCEPQKFFSMTDAIFAGQSDWARAGGPTEIIDDLRRIARAGGMSKDKLDACLQDADKAQALVGWYQENAEADGIQATPSLVVNGETMSNMSYAELKKLIDKEIAG